MLSELPSEIVYHIATFLPTASALVHLAQTCRRLYNIITAEDARIFRAFVQNRFPTIETPPFWKDATQALTSRARALDRHAIIGRFVIPPPDAIKVGAHQATRRDNPTLGYRPAIDSYEVWLGDRWSDRREVLAWGAADELALRIKESGRRKHEQWLMFNDLDHISSYDDICGVHLLRPGHPGKDVDNEHVIFGRVRGDLVHMAIEPDKGTHEYRQKFITHGSEIDAIELNNGPQSILAANFNDGSIAFFHTTTREPEVQPFSKLQAASQELSRQKCSKFLSSDRLAVCAGNSSASVYTITPSEVSTLRQFQLDPQDLANVHYTTPKAHVTAFSPLNISATTGGGSPGDTFLAAWSDGGIRLHDVRSDDLYDATFRDTTDLNPMYSIHPFGHDRFLVGAGAEGIVKIFDLRMPKTYSYLEAKLSSSSKPPPMKKNNNNSNNKTNGASRTIPYPRRDFSIFLSHRPPIVINSGRLHPRTNRTYRGPIYMMSSPSPSSATVYAGVVDGIVRLDFASTDDLTGSCRTWYETNLALDLNTSKSAPPGQRILDLSGYERPGPEEMGRSARLRTQKAFHELTDDDVLHERETGWDRRWKRLEEDAAWRRRDD
ncbi:hypothetical protein DTO045G8_8405 [Paecilomyces variotii]|nr:hypothetical protein DTO045G8_8405 [Paecilomyces variotii]